MGRWLVLSMILAAVILGVAVSSVLYKQTSIRTAVQGVLTEDFQKYLVTSAGNDKRFINPEIPDLYLDLEKPVHILISKELLLFQFAIPKSVIKERPAKEVDLANFQKFLIQFVTEWSSKQFHGNTKKLKIQVEFI